MNYYNFYSNYCTYSLDNIIVVKKIKQQNLIGKFIYLVINVASVIRIITSTCITLVSLFCFFKIDVILKIIIELKSIVIYYKFNNDFKNHINFEWDKKKT
jgi:hypothetical protein